MSVGSKRDEFAQALSGVPDCHGYAYRPPAPNVGDCWPVRGPAERTAGDAFLLTWGIRVVVPSDEQAADEWWDLHWDAIYYALKPVAMVNGTAPVTLQSDAGEMFAVQITVITEE